MKTLIAVEFAAGRFSKVGVVSHRKDGGVSFMPVCMRGQVGGYVAKTAGRFFAGEEKASDVTYEIGGKTYRATRIG